MFCIHFTYIIYPIRFSFNVVQFCLDNRLSAAGVHLYQELPIGGMARSTPLLGAVVVVAGALPWGSHKIATARVAQEKGTAAALATLEPLVQHVASSFASAAGPFPALLDTAFGPVEAPNTIVDWKW